MGQFEDKIKIYLDARAASDSLFAASYAKEGKSLEECCRYICGEVMDMGQGRDCVVMDDDDVYNLAVHYYDEDNIKVKKAVGHHVATDVELTEEEKEEARKLALERAIREAQEQMRKPKPSKKKDEAQGQLDLFAEMEEQR